jgi:hypothetical protein
VTPALASVLCFVVLMPSMTGEEIDRVVDSVYDSGEFQTDPNLSSPVAPAEESRSSAGPLARALEALLWILFLVGGMTAIVWVVREWGPIGLRGFRRSPGRRERDAIATVAHRAPDGPPPLPDHGRLAAKGRFADAIRALLAIAWADLERRTTAGFPPALTSREILSRAALPKSALPALLRLVRSVEATTFGGRDATDADYRSGLDDFRQLGVKEPGR